MLVSPDGVEVEVEVAVDVIAAALKVGVAIVVPLLLLLLLLEGAGEENEFMVLTAGRSLPADEGRRLARLLLWL